MLFSDELVMSFCAGLGVFKFLDDAWKIYILNAVMATGKISSWIDLDSDDEALRRDSEIILKQEVAWASHLSLQVHECLHVFCCI